MKNHIHRRPSVRKNSRRPRQLQKRPLHLELLESRLLLAGNPLFRINAGGAALAGTPGWSQDTAASPSAYVNASTGNSATSTTTAVVDLSHVSVPAGTPMAVFQSERFDKAGGANMLWDFPVTPGVHEVRLYFAETWTGGQAAGVRQFDVQIEGVTVLDNYDVFADVGGFKGVVKSFTVTTDANLDIDFLRVIQNPSVKAIEVFDIAPQASNLVASTTSLDYGAVVLNTPFSHVVTLTNGGSVGSQNITIDPSQASIVPAGSPYTFEFADTLPIVLSPGQSTDVAVTYTPTTAGTNNAVLNIPHSGANSPIAVSLTGKGVANININFTKSTLAGTTIDRPTKVQFGPDGRLYVAQQNGLIRIFTIVKNGPNDYQAVAQEQLAIIKNIPNHNDDGTLNTTETQRLVTGMIVTGTAQNPVLYVSSSDPRIGGGSSHADLDLDTNSGTISRVTWNGTSWVKLDLVRGLPRSEENHGTNGLALNATTNTLYVAVGGNTNMGAPSQNFALLPEYALGAAVLSVNLNAIGETTYDLPTLDDEDRPGVNDLNDPFGGNDGKNQAIIVPGGPVQVYSPGYRNPYDLIITAAGRLYITDNGPNAGWGGMPIGEGPGGNATNQPNEAGSITYEDQLHYIPGQGFYGGHPNPTRSNPANTFNVTNPQSPVALVGPSPIQSDYLLPVTEDGAIYSNLASTNGIDEYTANTFGGQMQGDLIIASFDNTVKRIKLNAAGNAVVFSQNLFSSVGVRPLDVEVVDSGPWAGNILVADIGLDKIFIYEPSAVTGNPNDLDGDGYTNADEAANGTDPNNAGDIPPDYDTDFISNLTDPDDDNDTFLDTTDRFAVDANNGTTTPVGTLYDWENEGADDGGLLDLGFTGLMTNGVANYESLFNPATLTAGGAAGVLTVDTATSGTARGATNTQQQAFQFGVNVANETLPFVAKSSIVAPFAGVVPQPGQEMGFYIGTGDQDNYVQIVLSGDNGGSIKLSQEIGGVFTTLASQNLALPGPGFVDFELVVDPISSIVRARFSVDSAAFIDLGSPFSIPAAWLDSVLAVGIIATNPTGFGPLPVTWDFLGVVPAPPVGVPEAFFLIDPPGGGLLSASTNPTGAIRIHNNSTGNVRIESVRIDTSTAILMDVVFDPFGTGGNDSGKPFTPDSGTVETGFIDHTLSSPHDGGFDVLEVHFGDFDPGEVFVFSIDTEPLLIKGSVAPGPANSGKISGLELNGATITIVFNDGTITQTRTFHTPDSGRASQTTATFAPLPPAPGLSLLGAITPPAAVTNPSQTLRVSGPAGSNIRLLQLQVGRFLEGVPGGGFDVDPFEANKALSVNEIAATIGAGGFVDVPVTLVRTEPEGGYNYFEAVIQNAAGLTGDVSSRLILQLVDPPVHMAAEVKVLTNGTLNNSTTETAGSFQIVNQSTNGGMITSVSIDLSTGLLTDVVFDPAGGAGDALGKVFTADSGAVETGLSSHSFGVSHDGGFNLLTINFNDFNPGETFTFSVDADPTSIKGAIAPGPQQAGNISGLELSGASITVHFSDASTRTGDLFALNGSKVNAHVILDDSVPAAATISMLGVSSSPAIVTSASQIVRIVGSQGTMVRLLQTESALHLGGVPGGGFDIDPFETNKVIFVKQTTVTIGASGFIDVPVVLNDSHAQGGVNHFLAVVEELDGSTSETSNALIVALNDVPSGGPPASISFVPGDYDSSGTVDSLDYDLWKASYGVTGPSLPADGNGDEAVDTSDYVIWRQNLGASVASPTSGGQVQFTESLSADALSFATSSVDSSGTVLAARESSAAVSSPSVQESVSSLSGLFAVPSTLSPATFSQPRQTARPPVNDSGAVEQAFQQLNLLTCRWGSAVDEAGSVASSPVEGTEGTDAPDLESEAWDAAFESLDDCLTMIV